MDLVELWKQEQLAHWQDVAADLRRDKWAADQRKQMRNAVKRDEPNGTEYSSCGCFYPHLGDCAPKS